MVREEWIRAGRVSQEDVGAGGQDPARAWVCFAALGGKDADDEAAAAFAGLAAGGVGFASDGLGVLKRQLRASWPSRAEAAAEKEQEFSSVAKTDGLEL